MANEFKVKHGLLVNGSGSTVVDVYGASNQLFSIQDQSQGTLLTVNNEDGQSQFQVSSSGTLTNGNYASGFGGYGWQISKQDSRYVAQFDDLFVRGGITVHEFVINQIRATNGSLWVTDAAKSKTVVSQSTNLIITFDEDVLVPFVANDIIRSKRWNANDPSINWDIVTKVTNVTHSGASPNVTCSLTGTNYWTSSTDDLGRIQSVSAIQWVRVGNTSVDSRKGGIYLTSGDNMSPYIDIYNGVSTPATSHNGTSSSVNLDNVMVRLGNLTGITDNDLSPSGYGLYTSNSFLKGAIVANSGRIGGSSGWQIKPGKITTSGIELLSGTSPAIKIGASEYSGNGIWLGKDTSYKASFWNTSLTRGLKWDGQKLTIQAENFKLDTSGNISASNATLGGYISASAGTIGGWNIYSSGLFAEDQDGQVWITPAQISFWNDDDDYDYLLIGKNSGFLNGFGIGYFPYMDSLNPYFKVDKDGAFLSGTITTSAGKIGGWTINSNGLSSSNVTISSQTNYQGIRITTASTTLNIDSSLNYIYLGKWNGDNVLHLKKDANNYFKWDANGLNISSPKLTLTPTALNISGSITTSAGLFGGWNINNSGISQSGVAITNNAMRDTSGLLDAYGNFSYSATNDPYFESIIYRYPGSNPTLYSSTTVWGASSSVTSLSGGKLGVTVKKQTWEHSSGGKSLFRHAFQIPAGKYTIEFSNSITGVSNIEHFSIYDIWVQVFQGTTIPNQIDFEDSPPESRIYCGHDSPLFSLNQNPNQVKQFSIDVKQPGLIIVIKSMLILPSDHATVNAATFTYSGFRIDEHTPYTELSKNGLLLYGSPTNITKLSNSDQNSYLKVNSVDSIAINANVMTVGTINASKINAPKQNVYYISATDNSVALSSNHVNGYVKIHRSTGVTCSINQELTATCRVGDVISICQEGNGIIHVTSSSPINIRSYNNWKKTYGQYSVVQLVYVGGYNWDLIGASN